MDEVAGLVEVADLESGGERWARFGYAVLDLNGPRIQVRYLDETGDLVHAETIT